jgi:hypothetical protein
MQLAQVQVNLTPNQNITPIKLTVEKLVPGCLTLIHQSRTKRNPQINDPKPLKNLAPQIITKETPRDQLTAPRQEEKFTISLIETNQSLNENLRKDIKGFG